MIQSETRNALPACLRISGTENQSKNRADKLGANCIRDSSGNGRDSQSLPQTVTPSGNDRSFWGALNDLGSVAYARPLCFTRTGGENDMPKQSIRLFDLWQETIDAQTHEGLLLCSLGADGKANTYAQGDYHRIYYGEVVAAYASADARERLRRALV
jgi:hypothetical protein